jgi:hypothetical protein
MLKRNITRRIEDALSDTPVVFLAGARQTGKSTLVQHITNGGKRYEYISLDDYSVLSAARSDPKGFVNGLPGRIIIDEVQRAPELFLAIKAVVDKKRSPGQFLLTGSANVLLLPKIADSLAGRMEILTLWPFSQGEMRRKKETFIDTLFRGNDLPKPSGPMPEETLWKMVMNGGYPEVAGRLTVDRKEAWFRSYITTILQRDIRDLSQIDGLTTMPNLLHIIAARTANLLNFADLSRSIQMPQTSLKRYLALLESTFLVTRIPPWSGNFTSRLTKAPKVHVNDTGLISFLLGIDSKRLKDDHTLAGQVLETFVVTEILKQAAWSDVQPKLYHFRTDAGKEVDIILEDTRGRCIGIEVKTSVSVTAKDIVGLKAFQDALGENFVRGIVLHAGSDIVPFQKSIHALPISSLWT